MNEPLSMQEQLALQAVCDGKREKEIAADMGVAPSTVGNYLLRARHKLGARTTHQAVAMFSEMKVKQPLIVNYEKVLKG